MEEWGICFFGAGHFLQEEERTGNGMKWKGPCLLARLPIIYEFLLSSHILRSCSFLFLVFLFFLWELGVKKASQRGLMNWGFSSLTTTWIAIFF